ncbi:MAG TPA: glycoside hydrolase family 65 [Bryobacteraceae bacterium]|nr:glycoside hydrolase family 65 [Bryobacteraceae bacterium]
MRRRTFLALTPAAALAPAQTAIDRNALVTRHNVRLTAIDRDSPLSVGNGEFAFTVDVTGLQSLAAVYDKSVPLCTQSQWGWHSFPAPGGLTAADLRLEMFDTHGRPVGYATNAKGQEPLFNWLRENPHRLNLARIGFLLDGQPLTEQQITNIDQALYLWDGVIESRFRLQGTPVVVRTQCHESHDAIAVSVETSLPALAVAFDFPYGSPNMNASDWSNDARHTTEVAGQTATSMMVRRKLDADIYHVRIDAAAGAQLQKTAPHRILLSGPNLSFRCEFSSKPVPSAVPAPSMRHWNSFWSRGAAIDVNGSSDPRAGELERRIILSQYLTAIQCAGSLPPQETGLTCNSWYGKYHLEMHWWHAAHFPMWSRTPLLERSLPWYESILPVAREKARRQGYKGARWPKMTSPDGHDSPSGVGEMLIWQQPHPILLLEYCHAVQPSRARLKRYATLVEATAEWMADYAVERNGRYVLGPPLIPAQENHPPRETWNPTYELEYWRQALETAQQWRLRSGLARNAKWDDVRARLSPLPVAEGVYLAHENCPQTFTERNRDHPSMLAAYGVCRGERVDREVMRRTLKRVMKDWRWEDTWGWDFPMVAMTAAKLDEPEIAVDALFVPSPKNVWRANGHNYQRPNLPLYLPGNGALLIAVAMMAGKWDGFPKKSWRVRSEGLKALL